MRALNRSLVEDRESREAEDGAVVANLASEVKLRTEEAKRKQKRELNEKGMQWINAESVMCIKTRGI